MSARSSELANMHVANGTASQLQIAELSRLDPSEIVVFLVQPRLVSLPARRERHDEIVAAAARARQHLAPAGQRDDVDLEARFLVDLARQRNMQRFAKLDAAARQRPEAVARRFRALEQQHLAVSENHGADGELRMLGRCLGHRP